MAAAGVEVADARPVPDGEGSAGPLSADEWDSRRQRDDDAVQALEAWIADFEVRSRDRAEASAASEGEQKEKLRLFRRQLAVDMAEERHWSRDEDRRREEEEMNHLGKIRDEDEFAAAVLKVMNKGTIEKQHRVHEQTIVDRRGIVEQLKAKAAERRAAAAAADAAEREAHAARLTALDDALHLNRVQAEEERRNRAQEWDEVLAERRRRERAREREREFRKMKEEQAELTHQRVVEHEWAAERARMDALAAARERMRLIEQGDLSRLREKRYRELMAAKQEFMDHAAVIGDLISSQLGTTSHLGLLCSLADEKGHTEGRSFGGLRRLLGATLRETHLSPQAGDPGLEGLLRGVPTCDKEVQTLKGATKGGGGKRGGSAGKK